MATVLDNGIAGLLEYRPMKYRPDILIPGRKPIVASREFDRIEDAVTWCRGFIQKPGTFIKPGTIARVGDRTFTVVVMSNGGARLQYLGMRRSPGDAT